MTRWSAITPTRGRRSALAYGSRSATAAEDNLNRLVHHERGRYSRPFLACARWRRKQSNGVANPRIVRLTRAAVVAVLDVTRAVSSPGQRLGDAARTP